MIIGNHRTSYIYIREQVLSKADFFCSFFGEEIPERFLWSGSACVWEVILFMCYIFITISIKQEKWGRSRFGAFGKLAKIPFQLQDEAK